MAIGQEILIRLDGLDYPPTAFYVTEINTRESGKLMMTIDGQNHCNPRHTEETIIAERLLFEYSRDSVVPHKVVKLTAVINPFADFTDVLSEDDVIRFERSYCV